MSRRIARVAAVLIAAAFVVCTPSPRATARTSADVAQALVPFLTDPLERQATAARPAEARFFDDLITWPVRSVRGVFPLGADRTSLALMTLERYLGWAVLQHAATEFRGRFAGQPATPSDLLTIAGEIGGRDLAWMEQLFDPAIDYDYAIDRVETRRVAERSYHVEVVARRKGNGMFAGTATARVGPYDAGRGVTIAVAFADGQEITDRWDGRDAERRFSYESAAPAVSAVIDPDQVIVVDQSRANNIWIVADELNRESRSAAIAWTARWTVWLQDRLLLWSALF